MNLQACKNLEAGVDITLARWKGGKGTKGRKIMLSQLVLSEISSSLGHQPKFICRSDLLAIFELLV